MLVRFLNNLSVPLCTHKEIRYAKTILLIGGEPEEEQSYTAKQIRQAVHNGGAKFICVNERPINLVRQAGANFIHINSGSIDTKRHWSMPEAGIWLLENLELTAATLMKCGE